MIENAVASGRRGFVFTIDATLALFLLVLTLIAVSFLSIQAEDDPYARLQAVRAAKDTLAVMEQQGILASAKQPLINGTLNSTLPKGGGAHMEISTYTYDSGAFNLVKVSDYGLYAPNNSSAYGARLDFVGMRNAVVTNYSIARMVIWQK